MNAIDTNVIAYSVDGDAREKRTRALHFIQSLPTDNTVIIWQVVCELGAVLSRFVGQGRTEADPADVVRALTMRFPLAPTSDHLVLDALRLRKIHQLSYWDALLIAGCIDAGVTRLYTEDLQGKPVIEGVEIINPFA
jgi:predicted nucleic acid-binding protein